MSWQKAEENLQQLIQSIESATDQNCRSESEYNFESFYHELPISNSKVKADENEDGIYNELPYATKTKKMYMQQNAKNTNPQNNIPTDFSMSKFMEQFLATDVRQLAAWMCEEDCRAFGWPPSSAMPQNQIQHFWWSLNEFGEQIRKRIKERSKMVRTLVQNSLHLKPSLLMEVEKKWILLADEMYTSFGNHFAFINIMKSLVKIENFPCNAGDDMKCLFQQKLLPIFNSINSIQMPENAINTTNNLLLPNVVPFLDVLFDAQCQTNSSTEFGNFQAKIDLLWTFARLTQRMFMEYGEGTTARNATGNGEGFNQINNSSISKMAKQNTCQQLGPPVERRMAPINPFSDANIQLVLRST